MIVRPSTKRHDDNSAINTWKNHPNIYGGNLVKRHDDNSAINTKI